MNRGNALGRIVTALNEAMLDDARWPEASALIDVACGAKGGILTFGEVPAPGDIHIYFSRLFFRGEDRSAWQREYFGDFYREDTHLSRLCTLPPGKIVPVADLFTAQELKTSRVYNDAFARFESQRGLNVHLHGPRGSRIVWQLADPFDEQGWSSARVNMIGRVLPHLRQYVRVRAALADAGALGASVADLLDHTGAGIIQLDPEGRIVEANASAAELLRREDGLSDRDGVLRAATTGDSARLQNLLARALPSLVGHGASGSMMVRRPSLLPRLAVHVKPVTRREMEHGSRRVAALVLIVDPVGRAKIEPGLVQSMLGLTATESEIVSLLAQGRTLRQIAVTTGREYSTVRTHLKHVFVKLGVSRQFEVTQLVRALTGLPVSRD